MNIDRLEKFSNKLKENMIKSLQEKGFDVRPIFSPGAGIDIDGNVIDSDDEAYDHITARTHHLIGTEFEELLNDIIQLFETKKIDTKFYIYEIYPLIFLLPNGIPTIKWNIRFDYKLI